MEGHTYIHALGFLREREAGITSDCWILGEKKDAID